MASPPATPRSAMLLTHQRRKTRETTSTRKSTLIPSHMRIYSRSQDAIPMLPGGRPCASHLTHAEVYHTRIGHARNPAPLARCGSDGSSLHPYPHVCETCRIGHTFLCRVSSGLSSQASHGLEREEHPSTLLWQVAVLCYRLWLIVGKRVF